MTDTMKRPQMILRRAMKKVATDPAVNNDWAIFLAINLAAASAVIAEVIGSDRIMADGGEREIKMAVEQFAGMLREDIAGRLEHERKQTRQ